MDPSPTKPLISLGLPVYNGANYIRDAIDSILAQTYTNLELIISDNASDDETQAICEKYASQDSRVRYYRVRENRGASWNFNNTFYLAQGKYFKWAAHDDILLPRFLELTVKTLQENPDAVLAFTEVGQIDKNGAELPGYPETSLCFDSPDPLVRFNESVFGMHNFVNIFGLIPVEVLRKTDLIGGYASSDVVLLGRLAIEGKLLVVPERQFLWRNHEDQSMQKVYKGKDHRAYTYWFNPSRKGKMNFPHWKLLSEYLKTILGSPLPFSQKMRGIKIILTSRNRVSGRRQYLLDIFFAFKSKFQRKHT